MVLVSLSTTWKKSPYSSFVWKKQMLWKKHVMEEKHFHIELAILRECWCCYHRGMLGNSNFLFLWDLSEMTYTIMIAFTLLSWIAVCFCKASFFTSVQRFVMYPLLHCLQAILTPAMRKVEEVGYSLSRLAASELQVWALSIKRALFFCVEKPASICG